MIEGSGSISLTKWIRMRIRNNAYEGVLVGKALLARDAAVRQLLPGRVIAQDVTCVFSHL
jgi:hypothetical protein